MKLEDYLSDRYTASTAKIYAFEIGHYLDRIGGEGSALGTSYVDLVGQLAYLRKRYRRPMTINRILAAIKSYYRFLVVSGRRKDHPGSRLRLRDLERDQVQVQDLLTAEELALLLRPRGERYPLLGGRNAVALGLLVRQALHVREIGGLRVEDIDLEAATVNVRSGAKTAARKLRLEAGQVMQLYGYLNEDRPKLLRTPTDQLLLTQRGTPERGEGVHYLVETLRPLVPHKKLTPTTIRQSVIAGRLKAGQDLRHVQAFAGHRVISTTEKYRNTKLEELRQAVDRFHPLATH